VWVELRRGASVEVELVKASPSRTLATSLPRLVEIRKTATSVVAASHNHASRQPSSM